MINNWQVPRNKRKLYPVVDILSLFAIQNLGDVWRQDLNRQLDFESELERYGIKRPGRRRDQRAGGARTYESWLFNLGLIFSETNTNIVRTTLAGDALLDGVPPVPVITNQLMKLQYPSPYSIRNRVNINPRFQVRPFRFLIRLLADDRVQRLSKAEIARFVITEGENETTQCFEHVIDQIGQYRVLGDSVLPSNFADLYPSSTSGVQSLEDTLAYLEDVANTIINYLEYTQLISRDAGRSIFIPQERTADVQAILSDGTRLRTFNPDHPFGNENFQRNFGLAPGQNRDNRVFGGQTVTDALYMQRRVRSELLHMARVSPIVDVSATLIGDIARAVGCTPQQVEDALSGFRPDTFSTFEANYLNMAISGRERATEFERATCDIFELLDFHTQHVGSLPRHPDIFVESPLNYSGIIDTKAYRSYSISNDHRNRMVRNYIPTYLSRNLAFFMYIADGFGANIDSQVNSIANETNVGGSVITARSLLRLLQRHQVNPIDHNVLRQLFTSNARISAIQIDSL